MPTLKRRMPRIHAHALAPSSATHSHFLPSFHWLSSFCWVRAGACVAVVFGLTEENGNLSVRRLSYAMAWYKRFIKNSWWNEMNHICEIVPLQRALQQCQMQKIWKANDKWQWWKREYFNSNCEWIRMIRLRDSAYVLRRKSHCSSFVTCDIQSKSTQI